MAKAEINLSNGTVVTIDGSPEEIAKLLELYSSTTEPSEEKAVKAKPKKAATESKSASKAPKGPTGHIRVLIEEDFFESRKSISDIQSKLEEKGHIYAITSLSPVLVRLVRSGEVRRLKGEKGWEYVNK